MAKPVYDPERPDVTPGQPLSPEELGRFESGLGNYYNQDPSFSGERRLNEDSDEDAYKDPREQSEAADEAATSERQKKASDRLGSAWQNARDADEQAGLARHDNQVGKGYRSEEPGRLAKLRRNRKALAGLGAVGGIVVAVIVILFSFLNVFKLDSLMNNIDARTFARLQAVEDRRSLRWMQSYMEMRLLDVGNPSAANWKPEDNKLFRANKVSSGSPIRDWYRTLRTSSFEQDLLEKQGIKFTSVYTADGKVRPGKIDINGQKPITVPINTADFDALSNGDIKAFSKYQSFFDTTVFSNDKAARKAIKEAVNAETHSWQVFRRRHLRKDIQNMIGVRSWRFFENTRNTAQEKKTAFRNKLIDAALPEGTKSAAFIRCLFGIATCSFSADPASPSNQAGADFHKTQDLVDNNTVLGGDPKNPTPQSVGDFSASTDIIKSIADKGVAVLDAVNYVSLLDTFSSMNQALTNGDLSKGVAAARAAQAIGLYTTFELAKDQLHTGDQVNGQEVNLLMQNLSNFTASEGWATVITGSGVANAGAKKTYCSNDNQKKLKDNPELANTNKKFSFAYACDAKKIGGGSNAATIEKDYAATVGPLLKPLFDAYNSVRNGWFGPVLDFIKGVVNGITNALVDAAIKILGFQGELSKFTQWLTGHLLSWLGAGVSYADDYYGTLTNWIIQGGAAAAEDSARSNGAAVTTAKTAQAAELAVAQYNADQNASMSAFDKLFSTSNPHSVVSNLAVSSTKLTSQNFANFFSSFGNIFHSFSNSLFAPFGARAKAANNDYAAAQFAGIQTFDFPAACNADPLSETPQNITNAQKVLGNIKDDELTWQLVDDSQGWYKFVYGKILDKLGSAPSSRDIDALSERIYNCALLDTSVRGDMGYVYGYTADNGLNDGSGGTPTTNPPTSPSPSPQSKPVINSWHWNGGNSFTYNVSNASSCTVNTDNPAGGHQDFNPSLGSDQSVTAGNGGNGSLTCSNSAGSTSSGAG